MDPATLRNLQILILLGYDHVTQSFELSHLFNRGILQSARHHLLNNGLLSLVG